MVLNHDCVRAILLEVEQCPFNQTLNVDDLAKKLPDFDRETIWYACLKMGEGGLLDVITVPMMRSNLPYPCTAPAITPITEDIAVKRKAKTTDKRKP